MSNLGKKLPSKLTRPFRAAHPFDHTRVDVTHEQNVPDLQASPSREALLPDCPRDGRPARIAPACLLGFDATDPHLRSTRFSLQKVFLDHHHDVLRPGRERGPGLVPSSPSPPVGALPPRSRSMHAATTRPPSRRAQCAC